MSYDELEELIPGYALGALDPIQREELERHVELCVHCFDLLRPYLETAVILAQAVPAADPPARLWDSIFFHLDEQQARAVALASQPEAEESKGRRPNRMATIGLSVAASFALVLFGVLVALLLQLRSQLTEVRDENQRGQQLIQEMQQENQELLTMVEQQRSLSYTVALPGTEVMLLANTDVAPRARGMLMASGDQNWGYVVVQGLKPPDEETVYQIWLLSRDGPDSGGVFLVDKTGYGQRFVRFPRPLYNYAGIEITVEPQQGSPSPSGEQVLAAHFR